MKTSGLIFSIVLIFLITISLNVLSQPDKIDSLIRIETNDGNEYIGEIVSEDSLKVRINTEKLGEISILKKDIVRMVSPGITKKVDGEYWQENPQSTRYFWAPNGYALKPGEAYYQNVWVMFNQVVFGVTNNFSLGGGTLPLFIFGGAPTPVWITPKISLPLENDKVNIGIGALLGTIIGETNATYGILYGTSTFGSRDKNLSLGLGYGYAGGEMAKTPIFNVSGLVRTGNRGYFISENYFFTDGDSTFIMFSFGGRRIIKKAGLDFGVFIPVGAEIGSFVAIPWLGLSIPFYTTN